MFHPFYVWHCKVCFLCLVALALFSSDVLKCFVVADFALSFGFNRQVDLQSQPECLKQIWQIWKILQQIKLLVADLVTLLCFPEKLKKRTNGKISSFVHRFDGRDNLLSFRAISSDFPRSGIKTSKEQNED